MLNTYLLLNEELVVSALPGSWFRSAPKRKGNGAGPQIGVNAASTMCASRVLSYPSYGSPAGRILVNRRLLLNRYRCHSHLPALTRRPHPRLLHLPVRQASGRLLGVAAGQAAPHTRAPHLSRNPWHSNPPLAGPVSQMVARQLRSSREL